LVVSRKNVRYRYAIVSLDKVTALSPYFNKMGEDGWELVSVDSGKAFFKRLKSTSFNEDIIDYVRYLKKELDKYCTFIPESQTKEDSVVEEFL